MVSSKKKLVEEFKKYNKELEKLLPKTMSPNLVEQAETQEVAAQEELSLITSALMDIRTEMCLLRKNLLSDVESMILKAVTQSQKGFREDIVNLREKMFLELKKNFSSYIEDLSSGVNGIRDSVSELRSTSELSISKIESEIKLLKSSVEDVEVSTLQHSFDHVKKAISQDLTKTNESLVNLENQQKILSNKLILENQKILEKVNGLKSELSELELSELKRYKVLSASQKRTSNPRKNATRSIKVKNFYSQDQINSSLSPSQSREQKVLDIDEKLKILDSLRI